MEKKVAKAKSVKAPAAKKPAAKSAAKTEVVVTKDSLKQQAEDLAKAYNEAINFGEFKKMQKVDEQLAGVLDEYETLSKNEALNELAKHEDPFVALAENMTYDKLKTHLNKEKGVVTGMSIESGLVQIDPIDLHKKVAGGIGVNKQWQYMVEKLNFLMTARVARALKIPLSTIRDCYAMDDIAKDMDKFKSGDGDDPTGDDALLEDLQTIVSATVGDKYAADIKCVGYLCSVYSKKNRKEALSVTCANHKYMRGYILDILHHCVTGKDFVIDFKRK